MRTGNSFPFYLSLFLVLTLASTGYLSSSMMPSFAQPNLDYDYSYDFTIRITYRDIFGTVDYADLPMGIIMQEDATTILEGAHTGGLLASLISPPFIQQVSTYRTTFGWVQLTNGSGGGLGGFFGWGNYSTQGWSSATEWGELNKSLYTRILKWIVVSNITIRFYGGIEVELEPGNYINVTRVATLSESSWVYNTSASSSFPENQVELDVEAHIMTIYIGYPAPPLSLFVILLIVGIIFGPFAAIAVSMWIISRRKEREELVFDQIQP